MTLEQKALKAVIGYIERNTPHLVRDEIRTLVSERDELASRVRELEGALCQISDMIYDSWTNGAIAKQIADAALNASKEQP